MSLFCSIYIRKSISLIQTRQSCWLAEGNSLCVGATLAVAFSSASFPYCSSRFFLLLIWLEKISIAYPGAPRPAARLGPCRGGERPEEPGRPGG
jgi:hypothetical protein